MCVRVCVFVCVRLCSLHLQMSSLRRLILLKESLENRKTKTNMNRFPQTERSSDLWLLFSSLLKKKEILLVGIARLLSSITKCIFLI